MNPFVRHILTLFLTLTCLGCGTTRPAPVLGQSLRIGVTPNYPPLIFKQAGEVTGLEADLARRLGADLLRPVEFVDLEWDELLPALQDGRVDVVMSGLSVTRDRLAQASFSRPYLETGIAVLRRKKDARKFDSQAAVARSMATAGIQEETSAEAFVQEQFPDSGARTFSDPRAAAQDLKSGRIDLFLNSGPLIVALAAEHGTDLAPMKTLLTQEQLAWAVRSGDAELLGQVNARLAAWKKDGTLARVLAHWLPTAKQHKDLLRLPAKP
jgi:ABC-type amino acid transport substrate-binding protein